VNNSKQSSVLPQEPKPKVEEKGNLVEPCEKSCGNHPPSIEGSIITCLQKNQNRRWKKKEILAESCEKSSGITRLLITGSR
jgi:hypothetical protein